MYIHNLFKQRGNIMVSILMRLGKITCQYTENP